MTSLVICILSIHQQNRQYMTYCIAVRETPSHGHSYRLQKIKLSFDMFLRYASGQTGRHSESDRNISQPSRGAK